MKRAQHERRKLFESEERRVFEEHVEDEYRKKRREREQFESKYLKIDKNSDSDCKKEHLEYLKSQAALTRSHSRKHPQPNPMHEVNRASPGFIGLSPANFDRIKQL
jgi:predicted transcriptional regulator